MIDILWHGRGGQGAFTAARLLGAAACISGNSCALAFPSFGPERRGAPMRAFTKIDSAPVGDRSAIEIADFVIYLDDTLLGDKWAQELKPGGMVLVNSVQDFEDPRIVAIDATGISTEVLGRPIPNTVFLGALSVLCDAISAEDVVEAIHQYMPAKLHAKNELILERAREILLSTPRHPERSEGSPDKLGQDSSSPSAPQNDMGMQTARPVKGVRIPLLRGDMEIAPSLNHEDYAHTTCYTAGHLVTKNAGWRNERPVIDFEKCTTCLQCYMYCPDGTIYKTSLSTQSCGDGESSRSEVRHAFALPTISGTDESLKSFVAVDYDFCKGCGVCVKACKFGAISMILESEANA